MIRSFAHPRTRSLRARPFFFAAVIALAVAGASPAVAARRIEWPGAVPWKVGGPVGFTVDAATFPDSAGYRLDVYVRLRPAMIATLARGERFANGLRLSASLQLDGKGRADVFEQTLSFTADDTLPGFGRVVQFSFRTHPGTHRLRVSAEGKRRLLGGGTGRTSVAEVEGEVVAPDPQARRDVSDLEFVWSSGDSAVSRAFERGGTRRVPNPERLYGLLAREVRASFVARALEGDERPWRWVARLLDSTGATIAVRETTAARGRWLHGDVEFDVASESSGGYEIEVKAWQEGDPGALTRRSRFSVAWHPETWNRNPRDLEDEAHFLLSREDEDEFAMMLAGEQERYLVDFWKQRDPDPSTGVNEARERFLSRVDFANRTYGRFGVEKGMFSDMGRVYIRYGEPNEVHRAVMPGRDNELERVIAQYITPEDRPVGDIEDKQLGADMRPFELWIYQGDLAPPPDADPGAGGLLHLRRRLLFLFVDERGLGDYRLKYSTE